MSQRAKPEPRVTSEAKVPEPSIDEILASIRRSIVPEDVPAGKPQRKSRRQVDIPAAGTAAPADHEGGNRDGLPAAAAGESGDDAIAADGGAQDDRAIAAANGQEPAACAGIDRHDIGRRNIDPGDHGGGDRADAVAWQADGPLLSARTVAAVDTAFSSLKDTVVTHNPPTLEDLAREMLRPMLKAWLDANLPGMVERLVQAEIERVSRRG